MMSILLLTNPRAEENFSLGGDENDSTNSQQFFLNLEFCAKILESHKHRVQHFFRVRS